MEIYSNKINFKMHKNFGIGIKFQDDKGNEYITEQDDDKPENLYKVRLKVTSWIGISSNAIHFYASLNIPIISIRNLKTRERYICAGNIEKFRPEKANISKITITRKLTKKDFNLPDDKYRKESRFINYEIGDYTNCFNTEKQAIEKSKKEFKRIFTDDWVLTNEKGKKLKKEN